MIINPTNLFVFGSNEGGIHGAGAARTAMMKHGAVYGVGFGHTGNCFAVPTKDRLIKTIPLGRIERYVSAFLAYAKNRPDLNFKVTRIGCGLAGLEDQDMAEMFTNAPSNCCFDAAWKSFLPMEFNYWGTYS